LCRSLAFHDNSSLIVSLGPAQTALGGLHAGASELKGPQEICPATRRAQN
jgi:hypothetical protein